jgi:hypothetical protein
MTNMNVLFLEDGIKRQELPLSVLGIGNHKRGALQRFSLQQAKPLPTFHSMKKGNQLTSTSNDRQSNRGKM